MQKTVPGMAASSNVGSAGNSWSKWQMALLVGAPVVVGVGCWYLKSKKSSDGIGKGLKCSNTKNKHSNVETTITFSAAHSSEAATSPMDKDTSLSPKIQSPAEISLAHKEKGNDFFRKRQYKEASKYYTLAINTCPVENVMDLSKLYQNRAAASEQMELYDDVLSDCTQALELNPGYVKALHRRAKICEIRKELQQSLEDLTAACILEGFQNQTTLLAADRILKELGRQHAKESMANRVPMMPTVHFIKTYFSSFSEDPTISIEIKEEEKDSGFAQAKAAFLSQNYNDVIKACSDEINMANSIYNVEALLLKATFHLLLGEHDLALKDFNAVIENKEASAKLRVNALIKRASLSMQLEQIQDCLNDFDEAVRIDPNNSDIYHHRGQVHLLMERVTEAMDDFKQAVKLKPNFPIAYVQKCYTEYRYAVTTRNMDKMMDIMTAFKDAIAKFPNCSECYTLYAQVLSDQQDFEQADQYFKRAIEVEPENATLYVHRGLLQLQWTGEIPKAISMIKKAIDLDKYCVFAYETLGTIEVQQGNLKSAVEMFNEAIPITKTELERAHLFSLRDAAVAQSTVAKKMGITLAGMTS